MSWLKKRTVLLLLSVVIFSVNISAQDRVAVIVGINNYDQLSGLRAGVNDAEKLSAYYSGIGFKVWLMDDRQESRLEKPSLSNLQRVIDNVRQLTAGHQLKEMVFSFAGHGVQMDGQNWLCFPETQLDDCTGMLNVDTVLVPWLRELSASLTLVYLDACRNDLGPMRAAGVERGLKVVGLDTGSMKKDLGQNLAVFYAAKPGSFSYEKPDGTNGFFTDTLLEALQSDQTQSVSDLYKYLRTALPERTEKAYGKPQIPNLGGDLDIDARFSKGKVDLTSLDSSGKVYVETNLPGATVTINGIKRGQSPILVEGLDPGPVTVEASKDGFFASTQVAMTLKGYSRLSLALEKQRGDLFVASAKTKVSSLAAELAIDDLTSFLKGLEFSVDGKLATSLNNALITDLEPGTHDISVIGKGWAWAAKFTIKPREVGRINPVFVPAATLKVSVPEEMALTFASLTDQKKFTINTASEVIKDFPPGEWAVTINSRRFEVTTAKVAVLQGGETQLAPKLKLKPSFALGEEATALKAQIALKTAALPMQVRSREGWDLAGWIGIGLGVGTAVLGGGILEYGSYDAYQRYKVADNSTSAGTLRKSAMDQYRGGIFLATFATGFAGLSVLCFVFGDHPAETKLEIAKEESLIRNLELAGAEY